MMISLLLPEAKEDKGRVTAGLPGLSPETRVVTGYRERQRFKNQQNIADAQAKRNNALGPDGNRDRTKERPDYQLSPAQLMKRLIKLNPNLYFERSLAAPKNMGVYLLDPAIEGGKRFIVGMQADDAMPEYSVLNKDGAYEEKRGWRTVLYRLIKERLVTPTQAEVMFGLNTESRNWAILTGRRNA